MSGETDLSVLLRSMRPTLRARTFVFATLGPKQAVPTGLAPVMLFVEEEGTTLIVAEAEAERAGLSASFPCRMITLAVHSSLEAVGLLAAITGELATGGIGVNAVSAYYHDHLFVPVDRAEDALGRLQTLARA